MRTLILILLSTATCMAAGERIVSTGGAITETIYAVSGQSNLVAVDISSTYPEDATKLPKVGYARQLSAEGILSMNPTLVIATDDAGPTDVLSQVEGAGTKVIRLSTEHSAAAAEERILKIGKILHKEAEAAELVRKVKSELAQAEGESEATPGQPKVMFIYTRGAGVMNVSGRGTAADAMLRLAGAQNVISGYDGYKPLTAEAAVSAAPEVIVVTEGGLKAIGGVDELLKQPGLALTPAGQNKRVVAVDDLLLLGFGPRLGEAVLELREKLHHPAGLARQ